LVRVRHWPVDELDRDGPVHPQQGSTHLLGHGALLRLVSERTVPWAPTVNGAINVARRESIERVT
jgi:hypothetical protein